MHIKQKFGFELKRRVNLKEDTMKIGAWASQFFLDNCHEIDRDFLAILADFYTMEMGPDFAYSYESLNEIADDLILDRKKNHNSDEKCSLLLDEESNTKTDDLVKVIKGDVAHLYQIKWDGYLKPAIQIEIIPGYVRTMLLAYLCGEITASSLVDWAEFIWKHRKSFFINDDCDDVETYYEDMWNVICDLSNLENPNHVTNQLINRCNNMLDKYFERKIIKLKNEDLAWILNGSIDQLDQVELFDEYDKNLNLALSIDNFKLVLRRYLDRDISAEDLSRWAKFVLRYYNEYCMKYFLEYVQDKNCKVMWEIINELSLLKSSEIIPEKALKYLSML